MTVRAVIFDLGHTLWDITPQPQALADAYVAMHSDLCRRLERDGLPSAAAIQAAVRDALAASAQTYFMDGARLDQPPSHTWVDAGCRSLGLELDDALLRELSPPLFATEIDGLVCADGTREALQALADAGYALGCITNTLADTAAIGAMLRRHGIEPMMRSVVVSADEGWRKPHRLLFEKVLGEVGAAPEESVFVGDSPLHDIGGAKAAGMRAVLTRQYVSRPWVEGVPQPDGEIAHLGELEELLRRW